MSSATKIMSAEADYYLLNQVFTQTVLQKKKKG